MEKIKNSAVSIKNRVTAAVLLSLLAAFVVVSGGVIDKLFSREGYSDWLELKQEPKVLMINVWHIVSFRPYIGSLGTWLKNRADEYSEKLIGIHFNVVSLSEEQAKQCYDRGLLPDVISFSYGAVKSDQLLELNVNNDRGGKLCTESGMNNGVLYALPFCASGRVLIYEPNLCAGMSRLDMLSKAGTAEQFKKGKTASCVCDLKAAGDIYRAGLAGNAPYFEAFPVIDEQADRLVQFVGIRRETDEIKLKYANAFIDYITSASSQETLCGLGLLPMSVNTKAEYDQPWIKELQAEFDVFGIKNCFE